MVRALYLVIVGAALGACSALTNLDDLSGDAGIDASAEASSEAAPEVDAAPPDGGCTVQITPSLIVVAPGAGVPATVTVARGGISGSAVITFDAVPSITVSPVTIAFGDPPSMAAFNATVSAQAAATDIQVLATIGAIECKTIATIAISGVLATYPQGTVTTFVVPKTTYLTHLSFDVWGGGGGGGGMSTSEANPGKGGGGGLSYANVDVVPSETLTIIAGTGGSGSSNSGGGGGGGCSEVLRGSTPLVIGAGGGGGGASENENGGSGGGAGHNGGSTSLQGSGGSAGQPTIGGTGGSGGANGGSLQGGAAKQPATNGGAPGGGKGGNGNGGGGGGCGVFGGGGGGPDTSGSFAGSGGGGGAGMISGDAGAVVAAQGTTPPNDPRFAPSSSVNTTGASATGGTMTSGGLGHVVISIF